MWCDFIVILKVMNVAGNSEVIEGTVKEYANIYHTIIVIHTLTELLLQGGVLVIYLRSVK